MRSAREDLEIVDIWLHVHENIWIFELFSLNSNYFFKSIYYSNVEQRRKTGKSLELIHNEIMKLYLYLYYEIGKLLRNK